MANSVFRANRLARVFIAAVLALGLHFGGAAGRAGQAVAQDGQNAPAGGSLLAPSDIPETVDFTMEGLKKKRLFRLLFEAYPDAEKAFRETLRANFETHPADEAYERTRELSNEIMNRHVEQHLTTASDAALYAYLKHTLHFMDRLKERPAQCVGYFIGRPKFGRAEAVSGFLEKEATLKADIVESSLKSPAPVPEDVDADRVYQRLVGSYVANGLEIESFFALEEIFTENRADGEACQAAMIYTRALIGLGEKNGPDVFKRLMVLGQ